MGRFYDDAEPSGLKGTHHVSTSPYKRNIMKLFLWCLVVTIAYVDCKGGGRGRGSGGRGRGRGSGGRGGESGSIFQGIFGGKSSGSHTYPASSGYSGHGSGGSHGYPSSKGLSGLGNQRGGKYGQRYGGYHVPRVPSYYTAPQYVYVSQYRQSNSRFNTLLLGLTMYNMGRSHTVHHHYYQDSYNRRSSSTSSSIDDDNSSTEANENKDEATCLMRIIENEKEEVLKIPCAIVTTFAEGKRKVPDPSENTTTVCFNPSQVNSTVLESNVSDIYMNKSEIIDLDSQESTMICKSDVQSIDPLAVTGSPLNTIGMECTIEIRTSQEVISNEVECKTLLRYAKMPVPENKDAIIMPPREELKEMLEHPPWWLSLFLAV